jgi:hypothetical protein
MLSATAQRIQPHVLGDVARKTMVAMVGREPQSLIEVEALKSDCSRRFYFDRRGGWFCQTLLSGA